MRVEAEKPRHLVEAGEYDGERSVMIEATQLNITRSRADRVIDGWIELFSAGPTAIRDLRFVSRTPARLFDSLHGQTQLRGLELKWGDYSNLEVLSEMTDLQHLILRGAAGVTTLEPLARLPRLTSLEVEGTKRVTDYRPLGRIATLKSLSLGPGMNGPWMHTDSIAFVTELPALRELSLNLINDSYDFSPILCLDSAERILLHSMPGMIPTLEELSRRVPGVARAQAEHLDMSDFVLVEPSDIRLIDDSPQAPEIGEEIALVDDIELHWSALIHGREDRIGVIRWARSARETVGWADLRRVTANGLGRLEALVGETWETPEGRIRRRLEDDLKSWLPDAESFRADPHGERRRDLQRDLRSVAAEDEEGA